MGKLTDTAVKNLKKGHQKADGQGLYIVVSQIGTKYWKFREPVGSRKLRTIGEYPQMSLAEAREAVLGYRKTFSEGINPFLKINSASTDDEAEKNERSFQEVFDEFCQMKTSKRGEFDGEWTYGTYKKHNQIFKKHVFPVIGDKRFSLIRKSDLVTVLELILEKGTDSNFRKVRSVFNMLFAWGESREYTDLDYARLVSNKAFRKLKPEQNHKHIASRDEFEELVPKVVKIRSTYIVNRALNLELHIFLRPIEIVKLHWSDVDWEKKQINIPASRMKMERDFIVPMSSQVITLLKEVYEVTGHSDYVFLSGYRAGSKDHISRDSLSNALRNNNVIETSTHGFRHAASSLLRDVIKAEGDLVELQLSHERKSVEKVYNKSKRLDERRLMMQKWSNYIQSAAEGKAKFFSAQTTI
jgi:integrase